MITKRILPLFAIALGLVLAVATSGFKEAPIKIAGAATYLFEYDANQPFDVSHVQNKANWHLNQDAEECDGAKQAACTIRVPENDVDNPGSSATLKSSFSISAAMNPYTNTAYVASVSDNQAQISNRTH